MRISAARHVLASHTKTALPIIDLSARTPPRHLQRQSDHFVWSDQRWLSWMMNSPTLRFLLQKINSASWKTGVKFVQDRIIFQYELNCLIILHHRLIKTSRCHLFKLFQEWLFVPSFMGDFRARIWHDRDVLRWVLLLFRALQLTLLLSSLFLWHFSNNIINLSLYHLLMSTKSCVTHFDGLRSEVHQSPLIFITPTFVCCDSLLTVQDLFPLRATMVSFFIPDAPFTWWYDKRVESSALV